MAGEPGCVPARSDTDGGRFRFLERVRPAHMARNNPRASVSECAPLAMEPTRERGEDGSTIFPPYDRRDSHSTGAMTQAMGAVAQPVGARLLRVGVIHAGALVGEQLARPSEAVSIGTTERNTFAVVAPQLPSHFELFSATDAGYSLNFTESMDGRVVLPEGVVSLSQLRRSGRASQRGSRWSVDLTETCRGKVSLGDLAVLFQFVPSPPARARPMLPAALRSRWVNAIDWGYSSCLAFGLLLAFCGAVYAEYVYDPELADNEEITSRLVTLMAPPPVEEPRENRPDDGPPPAPPTPARAPDRPREAARAAPVTERPGARPRASEAAVASAVQAAERSAQVAFAGLARSAEFRALTGLAETTPANAIDLLASGAHMDGSVSALAGTAGIASDHGGLHRSGLVASAGGVGDSRLGGGHALASNGGAVGAGREWVVERPVHVHVDTTDGTLLDGDGVLRLQDIMTVVRSRASGVRRCYERGLLNQPSLAGRMDVAFTIGTSGRIATVRIEGLPAAPDVGQCIERVFGQMVFPVPQGGAVGSNVAYEFHPGS